MARQGASGWVAFGGEVHADCRSHHGAEDDVGQRQGLRGEMGEEPGDEWAEGKGAAQVGNDGHRAGDENPADSSSVSESVR